MERPTDSALVWLKRQQKGAKCKHSACVNSVDTRCFSSLRNCPKMHVLWKSIVKVPTVLQSNKQVSSPPNKATPQKHTTSLQASHTIRPTAAFTIYGLQHPKVSQLVTLTHMPQHPPTTPCFSYAKVRMGRQTNTQIYD